MIIDIDYVIVNSWEMIGTIIMGTMIIGTIYHSGK